MWDDGYSVGSTNLNPGQEHRTHANKPRNEHTNADTKAHMWGPTVRTVLCPWEPREPPQTHGWRIGADGSTRPPNKMTPVPSSGIPD
jgi:hypothetical protein